MSIFQSQHNDSILKVGLCQSAEEWSAARYFRQKYFFDKQPIDDPYTWTFEHKDHVHFVMYENEKIIGYAHIQLWPENRSALRIIVIEEGLRNHSFGSQFMTVIEDWLRKNSIQSLHIESNPAALNFYKKLGYIPMSFSDPDGYEGSEEDIEIGKVFYF